MDILNSVATNLSAWMSEHPSLSTIEKLCAKSGVGFGTIRRAKNGEGNITVQNLEALAKAFGRSPSDLISTPGKMVSEPETSNAIYKFSAENPTISKVVALMKQMSEPERAMILERAIVISETRKNDKANSA